MNYSELTFQAIVEAVPNAIVLINKEGRIAYINRQTEMLFGYDRDDLIGQFVEVLMPPRFHQHHPGFRESFFQTPSTRSMGEGRELFALRKNGSEFPVEIGLNPLVTSDGMLVLASIIDITERKRAEERFRLVVESAPNAMILVNKEGNIVLANEQTKLVFGYEKDELIGKKLEMLIPAGMRHDHPHKRNQFFQSPSARPMGMGRELYALRKGGEEFPVEIGLNPIESNEGQLVLASIIDITERKSQELIISEQINELKVKNRELEQFSYIASHDLQEPLRTVSGFVSLLHKDYAPQLDEKGNKYLDFILHGSQRMSALIKGLLDYSRIGRERSFATIDCNQIVEGVCADLAQFIKESRARIECGPLPHVWASEVDLRLLFQNLISNAIKFKLPGNDPVVHINAVHEYGQVKFAVTDNGIGIAPEYLEKIFVIFQRLHSREEYEGTGIGLSHCLKIVDLHGGKIWVESEPGKGSTFYFTIPN